jgi:hypothetical protein
MRWPSRVRNNIYLFMKASKSMEQIREYTEERPTMDDFLSVEACMPNRLPRRKREILYAGAFRARSMRPALSRIFIPNELIRHCFLRWQAEKLPPTLGHHEKRSRGFSCNPRLLTVPTSADLSRRSCLAYKISPILRASLHGWCGNPQESHGSGYHAR